MTLPCHLPKDKAELFDRTRMLMNEVKHANILVTGSINEMAAAHRYQMAANVKLTADEILLALSRLAIMVQTLQKQAADHIEAQRKEVA